MTIAVFGATGKTGQQVVREALARGHAVIAVCRTPPAGGTFPPGVQLVIANILKAAEVQQALVGADAAVCVIGPRPPYSEIFCAIATQNIIQGMKQLGLRRLVCLTGGMVGDYPAERTFWMQWMANRFRQQNPRGAEDRSRQEQAVLESGLDWTIVKPPRLKDGRASGRYQSGEHLRLGLLSSLSRADLAAFMVGAIESGNSIRQRIFIRY